MSIDDNLYIDSTQHEDNTMIRKGDEVYVDIGGMEYYGTVVEYNDVSVKIDVPGFGVWTVNAEDVRLV